MRRPTRIVAWGLAASVAAAALAALVYPDSQTSSTPVAGHAEAAPPRETSSVDTASGESHTEPNESTAAQAEAGDTRTVEPGPSRERALAEEATVRERTRKDATEDVQETYSLLFEDLSLLPRETEDLTALLIEMQIEGTWHSYQRGRTIGEQERQERIEAAIGHEKSQQFLTLDQNRRAYWETYQIASLFRRHSVPLTERQRDGVVEMLVEVRARYPATPPPAELDRSSGEYIEHRLRQLDEFDRHVVELAPSVLSPTQVVYLFNAYEAMARDRTFSIEIQKMRNADNPGRDFGWGIPGRWNAYALRSAGL